MQNKPPPLLNLSAMARLLGVKATWLRDEAVARRIPAVPAGDTFLFNPDAVERVLRQRASVLARAVTP